MLKYHIAILMDKAKQLDVNARSITESDAADMIFEDIKSNVIGLSYMLETGTLAK